MGALPMAVLFVRLRPKGLSEATTTNSARAATILTTAVPCPIRSGGGERRQTAIPVPGTPCARAQSSLRAYINSATDY